MALSLQNWHGEAEKVDGSRWFGRFCRAIPFYGNNGFVALNTDDEADITRVLNFDLMDLEN